MANPTWTDVVAIAPGDAAAFTAIPVGTQNALLGYALASLDPNVWGTLFNEAVVYYVAHRAKLGLMRGSGAVTSETLGPLSRSYSVPKGSGRSLAYENLELTSYGLVYLELLSQTSAVLGDVP